MNLQEYKVVFIVVTAVLALLVASPALQRVLVYPQTEFFTEFWVLGSEHNAEGYPFNISSGEQQNVFLGISNHLGECAYYAIEVKFRNQTQPAADSFNRTPSSLPALCTVYALVADKESVELPVGFSFDYTQGNYNETLLQAQFSDVTFNDKVLNLSGYTAAWDDESSGFFGHLFFELWIYNGSTSGFQYHERFTSLRLNMTS